MTCGGFESTADGGEGDDRPRFGPIIDRDADSQKWRVESERDPEAAFSCVLVPYNTVLQLARSPILTVKDNQFCMIVCKH
jgi:hypothetical protein